jgi:hypothetical protein
MPRGGDDRGGDEREPRLEREQVAVHRSDEAVQAVPTESGAPVHVCLEQAADEARRQRQPHGKGARARDREARRLPPLDQRPLAHGAAPRLTGAGRRSARG